MTKFLRILGSSPPLLALVLLLLGRTAQAQVDTYTFAASSGTYTALTALATAVPALLADDAVSGPIALPTGFTFNFDGTPYNTVYLNSNGLLSFNSGLGTTYDNVVTGLSNGPANNRPFIAPFFDDLDGRATGAAVRYQTTGASPNRVFTVQWLNFNHYNLGNAVPAAFSFQVKLYETTNVVQYVYRNEAGAISTTLSASIGLAGVGTGAGSFLSLNNASAAPTTSSTTETNSISTFPATGQIYTFTPAPVVGCPAPRTLTLADVTGTGATLNFRGNINATTYTVVVTPQGGAALPAITTATSPVILTGLTPNTTYTVTLISNCASGASTPATITFATSGPYCSTNLGGTCGLNDVTSVSLTGTTLNATGLTCSASGNSAYTNYPASGSTTATLNGGVPYQLNVNTNGNSIISAWLDSNHNFSFEASEWVQVEVSSTANQVATVTLYVPENASQGLTGLRIRSRAAGNDNGATNACTEFFSGETKDFTVNIGPPAPCATVRAPVIGAITTTSASLSFTNITAANGYTVTVTPQGGTALPTITATGSPITLAGLTPNTTYNVQVVSNCGAVGNSIGATVSFLTLPAPPTNNECTTARALTVTANCSSPVAGTVLAATQSIAPATCGTATTANDVWYSFVASGINQTITVTGQFAGVVDVRSGACAATSSIFCGTFAAGTTGLATIVGGLTTGQTYFVRIYANGATVPSNTTSGLTICVTPGPTPPANDECAAATPLPISTACTTPTSGTVAASSQSLAPTASCGFGVTQANDVWYSFVANGTSQQLTFAPQFAGVVDVRSGTCANSASIYCNTSAGGSQLTASVTGLTSGQTYYVRVYASTTTNPAGTGAAFTLCLTAGNAAPPNDDCVGAIDVPVGLNCTSPTVGTNVGASASTGVATPTCTPNGYSGGDIWFKVTVPANGTVTVSTLLPPGAPSPVTDTQMSIYSGTCGALTELGCNDEGPQVGYSQLTINSRTPGEVLYVRVYSYGNTTRGPIAVCAITPNAGACDLPTNIQVTNIGSTTAVLSFTSSSSALTYNVSILRQGSTVPIVITPAPTGSPVQLTGLVAGSAYTVSINSSCDGGINSAVAKVTFATVTVCPPPTGAAVNNVTATTGRLSFTTATGAVSYTVTLTPTTGTPSTFTAASSPVDLTGLIPGMTYTVSVVTNCGGGRTSTASTATFTTLASYCDTGLGGVCGTNDITAVSITGSTLDANGLTCTTANGQAYTAYPATGNTTTELVRGTTYPLNVTTSAASIVSVWIDYNHNLTYETSEFTQVSLSTTPGTPATANITVQPGSYYGLTSMRVRSRAAGDLNGASDACTNFTSGETKDFVVELVQFPMCPAATALVVSGLTTTGGTLTFTPAAGAASYSVVLTPTTGPAVTVPATGSPVTLTGLTPSTTYSVRVVTTCSTGRTSSAATTTLTTLTPCPAPSGLTLSAVTASTATLTFIPAPGAGAYTLTLTPTAGPGTPITLNPTGSPVSLTGLVDGTTYGVSLVADCGNNNTSPAGTATFTAQTPCLAPTGLVFSAVTTTTATLTFTPTAGAATYTLVLTGGAAPITLNPTGSPVSLTGLAPGTTYSTTLVANCGGTNNSPAGVATLTTVSPCATPAALAFSPITTTGTTLTFTPSTGATGYTLVLTGGAAPITLTPTGSPVVITGLTPSTPYSVTLVADCGNGNTSATATGSFTTNAPCLAPTSLVFTAITPTSSTLTFTPSTSTTTGYTLVLTPAGGGAAITLTPTGSPVNVTGLTPNTTYNVTLAATCSPGNASPTATSTITTPLGTRAQLESAALLVYPNPSSTGQLTLRLGQGIGKGTATLFNVLGQDMLSAPLTGSSEQVLNVRQLATGVYTLQVRTTDGQTLTRKVVLE